MRRVIAPLIILLAGGVAGGRVHDAPAPRARADEHQRIVEHWTAARQAHATNRDIVMVDGSKGQLHQSGGPDATIGATWTGGGPVALTTGRVFFTEDRASYSCSGSAVHSDHGDLVLTAGHCVHGGGRRNAFVTDWIFFPGWSGPTAPPPLGGWTATDLFTTTAWSGAASFDDDAGFAVVVGDQGRGTLESELAAASVTAPTLQFDPVPVAGDPITTLGYPAAKKASGNVLTFCGSPVETGLDSHRTIAMRCDMTGGSSGGPWFGSLPNTASSTGEIRSLVSYGYASMKSYLFGPILDAGELATFGVASGSGDCAGVVSTAFACADLAV